jgi:uncharacterized membrane protein YfcA
LLAGVQAVRTASAEVANPGGLQPDRAQVQVVNQLTRGRSAFCPILDRDDTLRGGKQISALPRVRPMTHLAWWPYIVLAGAGVGICTGLFGVGGSSVATPVLALLGAPGLIAVASPLPATIPSAAVGAIPYVRSHEARTHAAAWSALGGIPGTVAGALLSRLVGGPVLLTVSGLVLIIVGLRVILPIDEAALEKGAERRHHRVLLAATMTLVGVFTGLLANGGGFLIVPLYLLIFGLGMRQAVGTSLLVIIVLAIPTLVTHWLLGHINWALAGEFALGQVPGSAAGSQFAHHVQGPVIRRAFGLFLVAFGLFFTIDRIVAH